MNDRIEHIYQQARQLDRADRGQFLARECGNNQPLLADLTSLLERSDDAESFFTSLSRDVLPSMAADAVIGRTIGHYRIVSHIDEGGTGSVYRAVDTRLDREVALKLLPPLIDNGANRALAEAKSAAALHHPNICVIHDIGETDDGRPFIAMELCEGETLKERLARGRLTVDETLKIAIQIVNALASAHARKTIHGDVKPANVMLGHDGSVKLLDFGLARNSDSFTSHSGIHGTLPYMAPEQLRHEPATEHSDLWSFGVVLYEMITGRRPFTGKTDRDLSESILTDDAPVIAELTGDDRARFESIIRRLLAKTTEDRYASTSDLLEDLVSTPKALSGPGRGRKMIYAATATMLTLLALSLVLSRRDGPAHTPEQRRLTRNIAAYELYRRGTDLLLFRSDSGPHRGIAYLDQAVALDSTFAGAYAAMTYLYWAMGKATDPDSSRKVYRLADSVARKSVRLAPTLPEAWLALGFARTIGASDLEEAETAMRRAVQLGGAPNLPELLGKVLLFRGKLGESIDVLQKATREDPFSASVAADLAHALCLANRVDEGVAILDRLKDLQPPLRRIKGYRGECYMVQKNWAKAVSSFEETPDAPNSDGYRGFSLARSGNGRAALDLKHRLENNFAERKSGALDVAMISAGLGDHDDFFRWLERSAQSGSLSGAIMSPLFTEMHKDARFERFRKRHHM